MTSLLNARKRADEFEALLNGTPSSRTELEDLAGVVTTLREHSTVAPRPEFAARLREQLMAEAATVLTGEAKTLALPVRRTTARQRRLVVAATAAVFVGGTTGMAAAAQNALPGDALYPIKRTIERAQAGLNTSDTNKGQDLLGQARDRLVEAGDLLSRSESSPQVSATIDDFGDQAAQGSALLIKAFEQDQDPEDIAAIRSFAAESLNVLQELAKTAPPEAQEALAEAARLLQSLDEQALGLCGQCALDLPPLEVTDLLLSSSDLKAALDAAAKVDNNRVQAPKNGATSGYPPATAPADAHASQPPDGSDGEEGTPKSGVPLKSSQEDLEEIVDPAKKLAEELLPGTGELLEPDQEGLLGPLVEGQD